MSSQERPTGVTILAVLISMSGISAIANGLILGTFSAIMFMNMLSANSGIISGVQVGLGIAAFVMVWGLWNGKSWAWTVTLILVITLLVLDVVYFSIFGIAINVIVLYYLTRPHVKSYFGKTGKLNSI